MVGKYEAPSVASGCVGQAARHKEKEENFGARARHPALIDTTVKPNALTGGFGFFQDQKFTRDVLKADVTHFFGPHAIKAGIDYEHIQAVNNNFNGGAGQRIYKLTHRRRRHDLLSSPVLCGRPGARVQQRRSGDLGVRGAADLRAGLPEYLVLRAGQLARRRRSDRQRRHPLGRPGRPDRDAESAF